MVITRASGCEVPAHHQCFRNGTHSAADGGVTRMRRKQCWRRWWCCSESCASGGGCGQESHFHGPILILLMQHLKNPSHPSLAKRQRAIQKASLFIFSSHNSVLRNFAYRGPRPHISMTTHVTKAVSEKCHLVLLQRNMVPCQQPELSWPLFGSTQRKALMGDTFGRGISIPMVSFFLF